jgi:predicted DCC family thiol-disulfide oxidoreductase YuxK
MPRKLRVFFDGSCPLCSKEIGVYKKADQSGEIDWLDVSVEHQTEPLPLPRKTLLARFHVQTTNGELLSGARGFIAMWRQLPRWRWLANFCAIPGVPVILELAYRSFLKVRPRFQQVFR